MLVVIFARKFLVFIVYSFILVQALVLTYSTFASTFHLAIDVLPRLFIIFIEEYSLSAQFVFSIFTITTLC